MALSKLVENPAFQFSQHCPAPKGTLSHSSAGQDGTQSHTQGSPLRQESQNLPLLSPLLHPQPSKVIPLFPLYFAIGPIQFRWRWLPPGMPKTGQALIAEMKGSAAVPMRSEHKCQLLSSGKPQITHSYTQSFICYGASRGCLLETLPCP